MSDRSTETMARRLLRLQSGDVNGAEMLNDRRLVAPTVFAACFPAAAMFCVINNAASGRGAV